ncbi:hypothetical protein NGB36_24930 [Streptomyces sp. RB6PN25]|uniref:Transposase n=1 Tax=Streptomyces humicola TaxID=2953240 RepID=A0ABT1Q1D5_9ACTN|nr:hypothetical protein [Streptomyces humicola]MCQ4083748.1 hypothetical protein [Streptomyces humicola]
MDRSRRRAKGEEGGNGQRAKPLRTHLTKAQETVADRRHILDVAVGFITQRAAAFGAAVDEDS